MRTRYAEIPGQEAHVFEPVRRFTRKSFDAAAGSINQLTREFVVDQVQAEARRRRRVRGLTTFNIVVMLIVSAVLVTVYISNVVAVDQLLGEQITLEKEEQMLLQERENLRAEINMLTSYNRIQKIAVEELGLEHAGQQPYSLTVYGIQTEVNGNR
jgi:cell division protein FtsL